MNSYSRVRVGVAGATGTRGRAAAAAGPAPGADVRLAMGSSARREGRAACPRSSGSGTRRSIRSTWIAWRPRPTPCSSQSLTRSRPSGAGARARGPRVRSVGRVPAARRGRARSAGIRTRRIRTLPVIYGLTERYREELGGASLVACAGLLSDGGDPALQPLVAAGLIEPGVIIDAKSGVSGAGKTPTERTHFSEIHGSIAAYGVFSHRHARRDRAGARAWPVTFVPHLVPLDRGILETIYARLRGPASTPRRSNARSTPPRPTRRSCG